MAISKEVQEFSWLNLRIEKLLREDLNNLTNETVDAHNAIPGTEEFQNLGITRSTMAPAMVLLCESRTLAAQALAKQLEYHDALNGIAKAYGVDLEGMAANGGGNKC